MEEVDGARKAQLHTIGFFIVVLSMHVAVTAAILMSRPYLAVSELDSVPILEIVNLSEATEQLAVVSESVVVEKPTPPVKITVATPSPKTVATPAITPPDVSDEPSALAGPVTMAVQESEPYPKTAPIPSSASEKAITQPAPEPVVNDYVPPNLEAAYRDNPPPLYPLMARRQGLEGVVVLTVLLDIHGRPQRIAVKASSGHRLLDETAMQSVHKWRFAPAQRGGRSIVAEVEVPLRFALR